MLEDYKKLFLEKISFISRQVKFYYLQTKWYSKKYYEYIIISLVFLIIIFYSLCLTAPSKFPVGVMISVPSGSTLNEIALSFKDKHIIRSAVAFKILVFFRSGQGGAIAGDYFFTRPRNVFHLTRIVTNGEYGLIPLSITVPEGSTAVDMAIIYERYLGGFDAERFVELALPYEGYLFPDTYFFLPNVGEEEIIRTMKENFFIRIGEIEEEINHSGKTLEELVIMASLLEKEARTLDTRKMISGLLWHRIEIDMPLQVDAVFPYILGKNTFEVTLADLKIDSPYNTYKYKGLPLGPIANPGISSLKAAADPTENEYIFYLSDMNGNMHYSKTYAEHKHKKATYLP